MVEPENRSADSEFLCRCWSGACHDCTSRQSNTHNTETQEICYLWHPWHGRSVFICQSFVKDGWRVFQCSLAEGDRFGTLRVPQWMFDRAVCCTMRLSAEPIASCEALLELKRLLCAVTATSGGAVLQPQHCSLTSKGDADATLTARTSHSSTRVISPTAQTARVVGPIPASQTGNDRATGADAARASRGSRRPRGGGGVR